MPPPLWLGFGLGHVFNDLSAACWYTYLLVFLVKVAHLRQVDAGIVLLAGHVVDAVFTPCVGVGSDSCGHPYGRRKTWHLAGTTAAACALPFLFQMPFAFLGGSDGAHLFYYLAVVSLFQVGWAAMQTAHLALVPELVSSRDDRVALNSVRFAFSIVATMAVYTITWALLHETSDPTDPASGSSSAARPMIPMMISNIRDGSFATLGLIVTGIGVAASLVFHCSVQEPKLLSARVGLTSGLLNSEQASAQEFRRFSLCDWLHQPSLYLLAAIYTCSRLLVNISQIYLPLYLLDTLAMSSTAIASVPLVMYGAGLLATQAVVPLNRALGGAATFLFGSAVALLSLGTFHYLSTDSTQYTFVAAAVLGGGSSIVLPTVQTMAADLITAERTESGATAFGIISFVDKLANGCIIMSIQAMHPSCDCEGGAFFRNVLSLVPAAAILLGALCMAIKTVCQVKLPVEVSVLSKQAEHYGTAGTPRTGSRGLMIAPSESLLPPVAGDYAATLWKNCRPVLPHESWSSYKQHKLARKQAGLVPAQACLDVSEQTPKAYIIHDNPIWVVDLKSALEVKGVPYEEWIIDENGVNGVALDLESSPPPGVFFNRVSPSSHMRGKRYACEFTLGLLHWLDEYGCRVINGDSTHEHSVSKVAGYAGLRRCGVKVPRTMVAVGREQLLAAARTFDGIRFMAKHNRGGSGAGVVLFDTVAQFDEYLTSDAFEPAVDGLTLLQEFVEVAEPVVTRVEFVGGELLYGVRILVDAIFNPQNCPADSCAGTNCPLSPKSAGRPKKFTVLRDLEDRERELVLGYKRFLAEYDIEVCGIEYAKDANGVCWSYDVNVNTNYNRAAERTAGLFDGGNEAVARLMGDALAIWTSR